MPIVKHIHRLKKHKYQKTGIAVFFCTLDCNYKVEAPFALGKETLCNICNEPFLMNEYTLKLVRPHCNNCGRKQVKDADGKKHYVTRVNTQILSTIASDEVDSLKDRLNRITEVEEDI